MTKKPNQKSVEALIRKVQGSLTDELRKPKYRGHPNPMAGHCYVATEALSYLLGGKGAGWRQKHVRHENDSHWFLKHDSGIIVDATSSQFRTPVPYEKGRGIGFQGKPGVPSERAAEVIRRVRGSSRKPNPVWKDFVRGEYWIHSGGDIEGADLDVGDKGHEAIAIDRMLDADKLIGGLIKYYESMNEEYKENYGVEDQISKLYSYRELDMDSSEINALEYIPDEAGIAAAGNKDKWEATERDARVAYARYEGGIQVTDTNFYAWKVTKDALSRIVDFLTEMLGGEDELIAAKREIVWIEEGSTGRTASTTVGRILEIKNPRDLWVSRHVPRRSNPRPVPIQPGKLERIASDIQKWYMNTVPKSDRSELEVQLKRIDKQIRSEKKKSKSRLSLSAKLEVQRSIKTLESERFEAQGMLLRSQDQSRFHESLFGPYKLVGIGGDVSIDINVTSDIEGRKGIEAAVAIGRSKPKLKGKLPEDYWMTIGLHGRWQDEPKALLSEIRRVLEHEATHVARLRWLDPGKYSRSKGADYANDPEEVEARAQEIAREAVRRWQEHSWRSKSDPSIPKPTLNNYISGSMTWIRYEHLWNEKNKRIVIQKVARALDDAGVEFGKSGKLRRSNPRKNPARKSNPILAKPPVQMHSLQVPVTEVEEVMENPTLTPKDKKVIDAFVGRKKLSGKVLESDGRTLSRSYGSEDVANWMGDRIVEVSTESTKLDQTILRYMKRKAKAERVTVVSGYGQPIYSKGLHFFVDGDSMYPGQWDAVILAYVPGRDRPVGYLSFSTYAGRASIKMVEVAPEFKRYGVATALHRHLLKSQGLKASDIDRGMQTDEGHAFRKAMDPYFVESYSK